MVYFVRSLNYCIVEYYYTRATHVLRICYDLSTQKLHYATVTLGYDTLPFLTRTVLCMYTVGTFIINNLVNSV